jgi:hypothetical protein
LELYVLLTKVKVDSVGVENRYMWRKMYWVVPWHLWRMHSVQRLKYNWLKGESLLDTFFILCHPYLLPSSQGIETLKVSKDFLQSAE